MFKLPVCPYCNTIYRYKDVNKLKSKKENECYHCKKKYRIKRFPKILILIVFIVVLCIFLNILFLTKAVSLNLITLIMMLTVTVILLCIGYFLIPFFITFKKDKKDEKNDEKKEKLNWRI